MITVKPISLYAIFNDCRAKIRTRSHIVLKPLAMCFDWQCTETFWVSFYYAVTAVSQFVPFTVESHTGRSIALSFLFVRNTMPTQTEFLHQAMLFALWKEVKMAVNNKKKATLFFCGWLNSKRALLLWKLNSVQFWWVRAILFWFVQCVSLIYHTAWQNLFLNDL